MVHQRDTNVLGGFTLQLVVHWVRINEAMGGLKVRAILHVGSTMLFLSATGSPTVTKKLSLLFSLSALSFFYLLFPLLHRHFSLHLQPEAELPKQSLSPLSLTNRKLVIWFGVKNKSAVYIIIIV